MKKYYIAVVCIIFIILLFCVGCSVKEESTLEETSVEATTDEGNLDEEIDDRQKFIDIYYPIMVEYYTKATDFVESVNTLKEYYEHVGHKYSDLDVIKQMDIYYNLICEKYKKYEEYLMENDFFNENILLFEKIFALNRYNDILEMMNIINENYEKYREDFLNGNIEADGNEEKIYDIGLIYLINSIEESAGVAQIFGIKLEPKETCYKMWLDYTYSSVDEYELANQQLMGAWITQ